jgi:hypothetical protein
VPDCLDANNIENCKIQEKSSTFHIVIWDIGDVTMPVRLQWSETGDGVKAGGKESFKMADSGNRGSMQASSG